GIFPKVPRNAVSVCRRARATTRTGFKVTVCEGPAVGVKTIDEMLTVNERMFGFAGSVLATAMVTAIEPVPPPPPPPFDFGKPLQPASKIPSAQSTKTGPNLRFMDSPRRSG